MNNHDRITGRAWDLTLALLSNPGFQIQNPTGLPPSELFRRFHAEMLATAKLCDDDAAAFAAHHERVRGLSEAITCSECKRTNGEHNSLCSRGRVQ